ncbi:hypothetical protein [Ornithinimicrobium kibberense]|uniref:hypothetical protein n=1 Tax=Ornithinimicrobium kibberense TaxID=282060 RepID=UPI003615855E
MPALIRKVTTLLTSRPLLPSSAFIAVGTRSDWPRLKVSSRGGVSADCEDCTTYSASGLE